MHNIVVIGGSAGSIDTMKHILAGLPPDFPAPVLVAIHTGARDGTLPSLLERAASLPVASARQGDPIVPGKVLVAPPDLHLTVARDGERCYARLARTAKENHARPAVDPLFRSAAAAFGAHAIGVVLSGFLDDGTVGLRAIKARGGLALVQDPAEAQAPDMPASAMRHLAVDFVCRMDEIAPTLVELVNCPKPPADPGFDGEEREDWIAVENRLLDEGDGMGDLDRLGTRVPLTCPECGGQLWEMREDKPLRYRCHTGHAFTARVLEQLQGDETEEALWAAVRALHEQEQLYRQMHAKSTLPGGGAAAGDERIGDYLLKAEQAAQHARLLHDLIGSRQPGRKPVSGA